MFSLVKSLVKTLFPQAYVKIENGADTLGPNILIISPYGGEIFPGFLDIKKILDHFTKRKIVIMYDTTVQRRLPPGLGELLREIHSALMIAKYMNGIDIVFAYQSVSLLPFGFSLMLRKRRLVYIGGSIYESFFLCGSSRFKPYGYLLLWKLMIKLADLVIVPTLALAKMSRLKSNKICEAPTRFFDSNFFKRYTIRKAFRKRGLVIGYVGRLTALKNVLALAEAFQMVRRSMPGVKLLIVGDGPFRKEIERLDNDQKTVRVTGWVENVEDYLNEMKLLVLPSKLEGLPSVVLEAMACGTPVLVSPVGGIPHVVKTDETGFLLRNVYSDYIAKRIIELLRNPEILQQVSLNASVWIKQHFNADKVLETWRKVFAHYR